MRICGKTKIALFLMALLSAPLGLGAQQTEPGTAHQFDGALPVPLKSDAQLASVGDSVWTDRQKAEMAAKVRAEFLHAWL